MFDGQKQMTRTLLISVILKRTVIISAISINKSLSLSSKSHPMSSCFILKKSDVCKF